MKKSFLFLSLFALQVLFVAPALAVNIPIINNSFEDPVLSAGTWTQNLAQGLEVPGWTCSDTHWTGVIHTGIGTTFGDTAAAGDNAAWVESTNLISQTLTATLQPNSTYTLSVSVGHRNGFPLDPEIQLLAGQDVLIDKILSELEKPAEGTHSIITLNYTSGLTVTPGQNLTIKLMNNGGPGNQPHFDLVTLDGPEAGDQTNGVVPEPASLSLLGLGLSGLLIKRRKRIA